MKRNLILTPFFFLGLIVFSVVCLYPQPSHATPPENIQIQYNLRTQVLLVTITHDSMFKGSHYIKFVEIKKNGGVVSINTYNSQPSGETFSYSYKIPAIEEDTIVVTATCNMSGSKTSAILTVQ